MSKLNILDLHRLANSKIAKKESVYNKVLENCHKVIERAADNGRKNCAYDVPEHMMGYPIYDLNMCLTYVIDALKKNGFLVKYYFPKVVYVSWDYDEISQNTDKNKLITTNSKTNGKLSINL